MFITCLLRATNGGNADCIAAPYSLRQECLLSPLLNSLQLNKIHLYDEIRSHPGFPQKIAILIMPTGSEGFEIRFSKNYYSDKF